MNNEKRYYVKRRFIAMWLIFAVVNPVYIIIWLLGDIRLILTSEGILALYCSLLSLFMAFGFRRMSICTTDDSIIHRMWLSKDKELQYRDITKVYKFGLLPISTYKVEGIAGNKSTKINIPVVVDGWKDTLRTVVSKVDAKIVDKKVHKMLGCEAPVKYLGCEATLTCNGNSMSHEKSYPYLALTTHVLWFIRNFAILMIALALSAFISNAVEPHSGILTIAIFSLFLIVTFFLIGCRTRARRWIHLSLLATLCVIIAASHESASRTAVYMFRLCSLFFIPMVIAGILSSKYSKKKEAD